MTGIGDFWRGLENEVLAEWTGLEPATPGVTGRYSNQLNYHSEYGMKRAMLAASPSAHALRLHCMLVGAERLELPTFAL